VETQGAETQAQPIAQAEPQVQTEPASFGEAAKAEGADYARLTGNGEVEFGDDFFNGLLPRESEPEEAEPKGAESLYTPEDLKRAIPGSLSALAAERMPDAVRPYYEAVQEHIAGIEQTLGRREAVVLERERQIEAFLRQVQAQQAQPQAQERAQAPAATATAKELAAGAVRAAAEKLGIKPDEIDTLDATHVAAITLAANEMAEAERGEALKRTQAAETEAKQRDFGNFLSQLAGQPGYAEFDQWSLSKLAEEGATPQDIIAYASRTGDYEGVKRKLAAMYREWTQAQTSTKTAAAQAQKPANLPAPALESSGGERATRKTFSFTKGEDLDDDQVANALMGLGVI
jgi:hypothetical protein